MKGTSGGRGKEGEGEPTDQCHMDSRTGNRRTEKGSGKYAKKAKGAVF